MGYISKGAISKIKDYDTRNLFEGIYNELDSLHQTTGTNFLSPANSTQQPASAAPAAPGLSATGSNGTITLAITPPSQSLNKALYYEISYAPVANFTSSVTTMTPTTSTSVLIHSPGTSAFFRVRASYDQKNWSAYGYA